MKFSKILNKVKKHYIISSLLCCSALIGLGLSSTTYLHPSVNANQTKTVQVKKNKTNNIQKQVNNLPLEKVVANTTSITKHNGHFMTDKKIRKNMLVKPKQIMSTKHSSYIRIMRQGRNLGWINANNLEQTNNYRLPYVYTSQFWPSKAKDACEIASLKTAMSSANKGMGISLSQIVSKIPLSANPNMGYTGNPYHYGTHASIYPVAMVKVAQQYGCKTKDISGANVHQFINYVKHGNPVVYESPFMMKRPGSDHDLTILGYKPGYLFAVDPFASHRNSRESTWVSISRFNQLYLSKQRQQKAMVIYAD